MPTIPEQKTTTSTRIFTVGDSLPVYHGITGFALQQAGWSNLGSTWTKGEDEIIFDRGEWWVGGEKIQFMEQIKR